ncbi:MAG TPA: AIR synthase related protein, partial [Verrucomicrobiae bacterium]|nr:AIR synthase related protein [Verrucomicrobiae bacterium]
MAPLPYRRFPNLLYRRFPHRQTSRQPATRTFGNQRNSPFKRLPCVDTNRVLMTEFDLIAKLTKSLPVNESVLTGAGDDCAVLDFGLSEKLLLLKTDAVVEGVHFTSETTPEKIGRKALGRCLSDVAAMAGTPTAALITIGLPKTFNPDF